MTNRPGVARRRARPAASTAAPSSCPAPSRSPPSAGARWLVARPSGERRRHVPHPQRLPHRRPRPRRRARRARLRPAHRARRGFPRQGRAARRRRDEFARPVDRRFPRPPGVERPRPSRHDDHHRLRLVPRLHRHADLAPRRGRHRLRHLHRRAACTAPTMDATVRPTYARAGLNYWVEPPPFVTAPPMPAGHPRPGAGSRRKGSARSPRRPRDVPEAPGADPPPAAQQQE